MRAYSTIQITHYYELLFFCITNAEKGVGLM